jgi:hypothetical protein
VGILAFIGVIGFACSVPIMANNKQGTDLIIA